MRRDDDDGRGYSCRWQYRFHFQLRKDGGAARRDGADATWTLAWTFDFSIVTGYDRPRDRLAADGPGFRPEDQHCGKASGRSLILVNTRRPGGAACTANDQRRGRIGPVGILPAPLGAGRARAGGTESALRAIPGVLRRVDLCLAIQIAIGYYTPTASAIVWQSPDTAGT